jgi:hypothetical protein
MTTKHTRLTHTIAIQLHLMAETCTICSSLSRRPVWKLLDTLSYFRMFAIVLFLHMFVPVLYWAPRHEGVLGEWKYSSTHSLTSALNGDEWSASRPDHFTPRERTPGTHWIGGWVGSRAVLHAMVTRKIPSRRREPNPRTPIVQPVAQRYTDWAFTAPTLRCVEIQTSYYFGLSNVMNSSAW